MTTPQSSIDDNKICQWYCCSCGQSYGSVIYKHKHDDDDQEHDANDEIQEHGEQEQQHSFRPQRVRENSSNNYIMDNLRYYSRVVYRDHISAGLLTELEQQRQPPLHSTTRPLPIRSISDYTDCKQPMPIIANHPMLVTHSAQPSTSPSQLLSPISLDGTNYQDDNVIVSIPTRFTCHRCDHMMCPYCPKLRLKDLR